MRADESLTARAQGRTKLLSFLAKHKKGTHFPIDSWYRFVGSLGLAQSARQRLSELRELGYDIHFDKKEKAYVWNGLQETGQLELLEAQP